MIEVPKSDHVCFVGIGGAYHDGRNDDVDSRAKVEFAVCLGIIATVALA